MISINLDIYVLSIFILASFIVSFLVLTAASIQYYLQYCMQNAAYDCKTSSSLEIAGLVLKSKKGVDT